MSYQRKVIEYGVCCADPLPKIEDLKEYYETKYYQEANGTTTYESVYSQKELDHKMLEANLAIQALKDLIPHHDTPLSLLEFGCGEGFFLKQVSAQTPWAVKGVDFSKFGIEKWNPDLLERCDFGDSYFYLNQYIQENRCFDICALRNVLEHVIDPKNLLTNLRKIIASNGFLLITVPNDYSVLQMYAMANGQVDKDFWFLPPDHLYYFNAENIRSFVEDVGYRVVDMFSSFPIDMFLFHPGSNYVKDKTNGKAAHYARITLDLLMAQSGVKNLLALYRSMASCGVGRDITIIVSPI